MKLYLDENLSPRIAEMLRARGLDATSVHEVGNAQLDDGAQLRYASREGRAIVTGNVAHFVLLARDAVATNTEHGGIILVPSSFRTDEFAAIADGIEQVAREHPAGLAGTVVYVRRVTP